MARLNKKVAIIGLAFMTIVLLAAIVWAVKFRKGDPDEFINAAQIAMTKVESLVKDYESKSDFSDEAVEAVTLAYNEVERNYKKAYGCARNDEQRIELLFTMATKLHDIDNKYHVRNWQKLYSCWKQVVTINPKNTEARLKLLNFSYDQQLSIVDLMPAGDASLWVEIEKQATELIDVMKEQDLPASTHVLKARAWATLGMADLEKNPEEYIDKAIEQFEKLLKTAPDDVQIYELLGQAYIHQGEKRKALNVPNAMQDALEKREELILLSLENAKDKAKANVNLLSIRFSKTIGAAGPLSIRLGQCLKSVRYVKSIEKSLAESKKNNNTQELEINLKKSKAALANLRKQIQNESIALSAAHSLSPEIQENLINLLAISDPEVFRLEGRDFVKTIESQIFQPFKDKFKALSTKYPSSPDIHAIFSKTLAISEPSNFDDAIEEISKAIELDNQSPIYAFAKIGLLYKKAMVKSDTDALEEGIKTAENALDFPDVSVDSGPKEHVAKRFRLNYYNYLAKCHIERSLIAQAQDDDAQSERSISNAEQAIHEIKQFAKADEFIKQKWDGLLAMAKGEKIDAISNLYNAQRLLKTTKEVDTHVSYFLSKLLAGKAETGSRIEFLRDALVNKFESNSFVSIAGTRPEALLDYAELLLKMKQFTVARNDVAMIYEEKFGINDRSNSVIVIADIAFRDFDEAEKRLSKMDPESNLTVQLQLNLANTRMSHLALQLKALENGSDGFDAGGADALKKEIKQLKTLRFQLARKHIKMGTDNFPFPSYICVQFLIDGEPENANKLADIYIAATEKNTEALFYKAVIAQPDPLNIPEEKQLAIREQIFNDIDDELQRHITLGRFYFRKNDKDKSLDAFKSALKVDPDNTEAIGGVFDVAMELNDIAAASEILESVKRNNIDYCDGELFAARIDIVNKEYDSAIKRIDECLKKRPIFPYAYILKSRIYAETGNHEEAVKAARAAARINSMDGNVAKQVIVAIDNRNIALGKKVTDAHLEEMSQALKRAIFLSQNELNLRAVYARHIYETEPESSISIMQKLVKKQPTVEYYILLGRMARDLAIRKINKSEKQFYFDIAEPAFENAYQLSPKEDFVVDAYCDFLRLTGKHDQAVKILEDRGELLSVFHLRDGQFEKAKAILIKLYETKPEDIRVLRGLMKTSKETSDKDGLIKYSQELLAVDNSIDNQLLQIQMYLDSGLVSESTALLASFRTRYPDEQQVLLYAAWSDLSNGKLDKAQKLVDKYLAVYPDNPIAWRLRGQIRSSGGDYEKAIQDLNKSRSIEDNSSIQMELARVFSKCGKMTDAIGVLTPALKDDRAPMRMLIMLEQLYTRSGRKSDLPGFYSKTLEKYPESINWYFRAGRFSLNEGKYFDAEKYFLKALQLSKDTQNTFIILDGYLQAIRSSNEYQKAIEFASKYINTKYAPIAYLNMANAKDKLLDRSKSLEYFFKAIEASGDNSFYVLKILSNMSDVIGSEEVVKWCMNELARDANSFAANRMMSTIMVDKQQFSEAIAYIENCLKGFKVDSTKYLELLAIKANIAVGAYMKNGVKKYLDLAITTNTYILTKNPNNPGVLNNLSYFYAKTNTNVDKAVEYGKKAYKLNPNDSNVMDTYAFALCKTGEYKSAKELLLSAIGIIERGTIELPWDLINHLGMAHEGLSEMKEAKENYKKALELAGNNISKRDKDELIAAVTRVSN